MEPGPVAVPARRFHLRIEDVLLFLWLVLRPLLVPDQGRGVTGPGPDVIGGLFDLVALCAAAACIAARRADATHTGLVLDGNVAYAVGPLFGAVAFALTDTVTRLGLGENLAFLPLVLPIGTAIAARIWLPPTTVLQRRALVTPFILATSGFFSEFVAGFSDILDMRRIGGAFGTGEFGLGLLVFGFAIAGILVFYLMLVFAPRQIAEREGTTLNWAIRFATFLVGLSLGATLAGIIHGT